jgi:hypothetical protein
MTVSAIDNKRHRLEFANPGGLVKQAGVTTSPRSTYHFVAGARNHRLSGLLRLMAYNHPPFWHTVAILAAMVLVLYVIWGPS